MINGNHPFMIEASGIASGPSGSPIIGLGATPGTLTFVSATTWILVGSAWLAALNN